MCTDIDCHCNIGKSLFFLRFITKPSCEQKLITRRYLENGNMFTKSEMDIKYVLKYEFNG